MVTDLLGFKNKIINLSLFFQKDITDYYVSKFNPLNLTIYEANFHLICIVF